MNGIANILNKPYPNEFRSGKTITLSLIGAICVTLTLFIFQPFGLSKDSQLIIFRNCLVFGSITYLVIFFTGFVQNNYFKEITEEEQWTIKKEILTFIIILIVIGALNILASKYLLSCHLLTIYGVMAGLLQTVVVGIVPITVITFIKHIKLVNRYAQEAKRLEAELSKIAVAEEEPEAIIPVAEMPLVDTKNNHSKLVFEDFNPDNIMLISAADNYIKIYFHQENGTIQSSLKRLTMKNAEDILCATDTRFFRCHRAYIVRLDKVEHIAGNAQGYKLQVPGIDFVVPVSRALNNIIADKIKHRNSLLRVA